jgi:hypothetical protein
MTRTTFDAYRRNINSQNGEDGVIEELVRRIGIQEPGTCVEFGAGNGRDFSNTLRLIERNWRAVYIEADEASARACHDLAAKYQPGQVTVLHGLVGLEPHTGLDAMLFAAASDIDEVDVMSIDIDSYDLAVWRNIHAYRAKIVVIEINSGIPVGVMQEHGDGKQGNSFSSMLALGREKGYTLACHTGNLVFVDDEYAGKIGLKAEEIVHPEILFDDTWVKWSAQEARARAAKTTEIRR